MVVKLIIDCVYTEIAPEILLDDMMQDLERMGDRDGQKLMTYFPSNSLFISLFYL